MKNFFIEILKNERNCKNKKMRMKIIDRFINIKEEKKKKKKKGEKRMKIECKYKTRNGRCKLSSKDPKTGFYEKCVFLNGFHPCNLALQELKDKKGYLMKAQFLCIALSRCNCKADKEQKEKLNNEIQKEIRKIDVKIKILERA